MWEHTDRGPRSLGFGSPQNPVKSRVHGVWLIKEAVQERDLPRVIVNDCRRVRVQSTRCDGGRLQGPRSVRTR
jgi:hypothetical protein